MAKEPLTAGDIEKVETNLWNTVRALEAIEHLAVEIAQVADGDMNALAEGIAGIAAVTALHVRRQQVALGGAE